MIENVVVSGNGVAEQRDAFIGRMLEYASGAFNIFAIYIGDRLGLYRALAEGGPTTPAGLAARTGTHTRYIREWLEQQAVAAIVEVEDENEEAEERRYFLPAGHIEPLIDCSSLNYLAPLAQALVGAVTPLDDLISAYKNGGGVPFSAYGSNLREGQAAINYPSFAHQLASEWIPAMADVHKRLLSDPPARVADIGCGYGWSNIGIARGYPNARVDGYDLDEPSIRQARLNAERNHVSERVSFQVRDAGDPALEGQYDLVTAFECIHDMSDPVGVLRKMRKLAGDQGAVLVMDERVGEKFSVNGNDIDWMMYGWSIFHCLPVGMADSPATGTGTVMRPETLHRYATEAGFSSVEILPIDHFFFRFYRLKV